MATTAAAAQTKEHEKYALNLPGYGNLKVDDKTHVVQIDIFILGPLYYPPPCTPSA